MTTSSTSNRKKESKPFEKFTLPSLYAEAERYVEALAGGDSFVTKDLTDWVEEVTGGYTAEQIRRTLYYLEQVGIVQPHHPGGGPTKVYDLNQAKDIFVATKLRYEYGLAYGRIDALISARRGQIALVDVFMTQAERLLKYVRSRLLQVILTALCDGQTLRSLQFVVRRVELDSRNDSLVRQEISLDRVGLDELYPPLGQARFETAAEVTAEGEILFLPNVLDRITDPFLWRIRIPSQQPHAVYDFLIQLPSGFSPPRVMGAVDRHQTIILGHLLQLCFAEPRPSISDHTRSKAVAGAPKESADMLTGITDLVISAFPWWEHCAILKPSAQREGELKFIATSAHFPEELERLTISPAQHATLKWLYENNQTVLLERVRDDDDPRFLYEAQDVVAVIPAATKRGKGVVIYLGASKRPDANVRPAQQEELKALRILGEAAAEITYRRVDRTQTVAASLSVLAEPPFSPQPLDWASYESALLRVVQEIQQGQSASMGSESLFIVCIRIDNYAEIKQRSEQIARDVRAQVVALAHKAFLDEGWGAPRIFATPEERDVVCLSPRIGMDDETERRFREDFSDRLNSIPLPLERGADARRLICSMWSMPFRYSTLLGRLGQSGVNPADLAKDLAIITQKKFGIMVSTHRFHELEDQRRYKAASAEIDQALEKDPESAYLMRHKAKNEKHQGNYLEAARWWELARQRQSTVSEYRHLALLYTVLQQYDKAAEQYEEALKLDPQDAELHMRYAKMLVLQGTLLGPEYWEEAVARFREAARYQQQNPVPLLLLQCEAFLLLKRYEKAIEVCQQASDYEPDNDDILYFLAKAVAAQTRSKADN